jgi:UDP-N-acetylmuramoyl-L-alanyl-D-glutamate--2,6-diaminopimelate ligase
MKLSRLIDELPVRIVCGDDAAAIGGVTDDSRQVRPGDLFVARPGLAADGRRFVDDAVRRGAIAVLGEDLLPRPDAAVLAPVHAGGIPRLAATLADRIHGRPSRRLRLVGITGTNGKTTTAWLVHQLLTTASRRCGLIGTVAIDDGRRRTGAELTTPGSVALSRMLREMADNGCDSAVLEVSSHALDQARVDALRFEVGVFTNLSGDHLDYHGTLDAYAAAKARLFERLDPGATAIVNVDDPASETMLRRCRARVIRCSPRGAPADASATVRRIGADGTDVRLDGPWGVIDVTLPLVGEHNVANALQATATAHVLGLEIDVLAGGLRRCAAPPGRLEPVDDGAVPFRVLVDYAHTDDALLNVLAAVRPLVRGDGRLRVVFGCGGDRDRTKRPRMAATAWRYADEVIVTSDNPRTEDPEAIVDDVMSGVPEDRVDRTTRLVDRRRAIEAAIARSARDDVVLIAGKGHEDYQIIGTEKRPFDDREVARAALRARAIAGGSQRARAGVAGGGQ